MFRRMKRECEKKMGPCIKKPKKKPKKMGLYCQTLLALTTWKRRFGSFGERGRPCFLVWGFREIKVSGPNIFGFFFLGLPPRVHWALHIDFSFAECDTYSSNIKVHLPLSARF